MKRLSPVSPDRLTLVEGTGAGMATGAGVQMAVRFVAYSPGFSNKRETELHLYHVTPAFDGIAWRMLPSCVSTGGVAGF